MSTKLSAYVVENHDEALPVLYRAIGKKLLPLEGGVLLHFDSHPDMLLPRDLEVSDIYDKHRLFELLSIENWILPAVFAGHFTTLVWIKPPWSEQMAEGYSQFYIGKHRETDKIRVTSKMSYFVGEALYCHEDELTDKRLISLYVIDISSWRKLLKVPVEKQVPLIVRQHSQTQTANTGRSTSMLSSCIETRTSETTCSLSDVSEHPPKKCKLNDSVSDSSHSLREGSSQESPTKLLSAIQSSDANLSCMFTPIKDSSQDSGTNLSSEVRGEDSFNESCSSAQADEIDSLLAENEDSLIGDENITGSNYCHFLHSPEWLTLLSLLSKKPYVLDIDLDFFSTMDPFKVQFTSLQYKLLKKLYAFEKSTADSDESILACVATREKQLRELKSIFTAIQSDTEVNFGNSERETLIRELVRSLVNDPPQGIVTAEPKIESSNSGNAAMNANPSTQRTEHKTSNIPDEKSISSVSTNEIRNILKADDKNVKFDFDWLHEIGCGCDDTELPHHVSSEAEIEDLICGVEDVLGTLPEPKIITVARSSEDDYCPKFQVDKIQDLTLNMLRRLYQQCNVTMEYMADASP